MTLLKNDDVGPPEATCGSGYPQARRGQTSLKRAALNEWENEGGHISGRHRAKPLLDDSPAFSLSLPELAAMRARLHADFSNGLVGERHNTFQHRTRVLAQLTKAFPGG